ncbi:hypothetical protein GCM10020295_71320 [Streptomyces cinereospinus]
MMGRFLPRDHGFCPHVVARRKALVLDDVRDYPRFAGNPVVDEYGVHSYLGAPLVDTTAMVLGTVCVADVSPGPGGGPVWRPSRRPPRISSYGCKLPRPGDSRSDHGGRRTGGVKESCGGG